MTLCVDGIWRIFGNSLPIVIYTHYSFMSPAKFERCVPSDIKIKGTSVSPTLSVDLKSTSMLKSSSISPYLSLLQPVCSVHFGIEAFWWSITVNAMLRGVNDMLAVGWPPHRSSHTFDDFSTPIFERAFVIVMTSHILQSV